MSARAAPRPSLTSIALAFAAISATAFGGGQKASIRRQALQRGWMDADTFMDGLEIAQVLPGPNVLNLAIYCGQRARGIPGAAAAFLGASIPPFLIVLAAGALYFKYSGNPYVHGALLGCAAGAIGLTIGNALQLTWEQGADWVRILLLALTAAAVSILKMPLLLVLVIFGGAGIVREYLRARRSANG